MKYISLLNQLNTAHEKEKLLRTLFTKTEIEDVEMRISILEQLLLGIAQRKIVKNLGVAIATVTKWSKVLQRSDAKWLNNLLCDDSKVTPLNTIAESEQMENNDLCERSGEDVNPCIDLGRL